MHTKRLKLAIQGFLEVFKAGQNKLGKRILLWMLLVSSLFTALISGVQIFTEYRRDIDLLQSRVDNVIKANQATLALAVWTENPPLIDSVFQGVGLDPDFRYLAVERKDSPDLVSEFGKPLGENHFERRVRLSYKEDEKVIELDDYWVLHVSLERVTSNVLKRGMMVLISQGLKTFAVSFIILFIINFLFTSHLLTIVNYLKRVNFSQQVGPLTLTGKTSKDEIDVVVDNINMMGTRLYESYQTLNEFSTTLENLVIKRTQELENKNRDMAGILNNINQGIFTIGQEQKVQREYSAFLTNIFEQVEPSNKDAVEFMFTPSNVSQEQVDRVKSLLVNTLGEDVVNYVMNKHLFPVEYIRSANKSEKRLEVTWQPITGRDNETIEKMLVVVRDVTELHQLRRDSERKERELAIVGQILNGSIDRFERFSKSLIEELERLSKLLQVDNIEKSTYEELLRALHTFKGNGNMLGYKFLSDRIHETEKQILALRAATAPAARPQEYLERLGVVRKAWDEYLDTYRRKFSSTEKGDKEQMFDDIRDIVTRTMDPMELRELLYSVVADYMRRDECVKFEALFQGLAAGLSRTAIGLGKADPILKLEPCPFLLRSTKKDLLVSIFNHLLRNSADHGIESPQERIAAGKAEHGTITVKITREGDFGVIRYSDDGRGLNLKALETKAPQMLGEKELTHDVDIANLIFLAGMTTAAAVTDISGRGVGMDAVRNFLRKSGGDIRIQFTGARSPEGFRTCEFRITLPFNEFFLENRRA